MRVSIQLITRDRNDALALLLESLRNQTYKEWDVVILDNSEGQKMNEHFLCAAICQRLQLEGHRIHYVHMQVPKEERDVGKLRNKCMELDPWKHEICVRVDDDSVLEKNYLDRILGPFYDTYPFDPEKYKVGICGGIVPYYWSEKIYKIPPKTFNKVPEFFFPWEDDCINFYRTEGYFESGHVRSSYAFRRSLWEKIKFEETTGPTGFTEETTFCVKAQILGYKVLINPNAVCWHLAVNYGAGRDNLSELDKMGAIRKMQIELNEFRNKHNGEVRGYP